VNSGFTKGTAVRYILTFKVTSRIHRVSRGSSVSIVSGYGLDDRAIEVRSPAEANGFFLYPLCPDRLWGPPSLLYNGYRGSFPRGVTLTTHPHLVPEWVGAIHLLPPAPPYVCFATDAKLIYPKWTIPFQVFLLQFFMHFPSLSFACWTFRLSHSLWYDHT
jgi:hypothetical protein